MNDPQPNMHAYVCSACGRQGLVVGETTEPLRCICGGELTPSMLSPGQYELIGQGGIAQQAAAPPPSPPAKEADLGYGASHGYDATHGGPSGPGDAPARNAPTR
jgi:hypothetical protein